MKIGILGAGQLGRMLAHAGRNLDIQTRFLDPAKDACARDAGEHIAADYDDPTAISQFADGLDLVTWEFENVSRRAVREIARCVPVHPQPEALRTTGDRLYEKLLFAENDIPVPPFNAVYFRDELEEAIESIGLPVVVKTRRLGYDGKGQAVIRDVANVESAWTRLQGTPLLVESMVNFSREVSVVAARDRDGKCVFYPLVENHHREGILRLSIAPAPGATAELEELAQEYTRRILEALGYTGVLAIEFFAVDEELLANEIAPRVHNSGHWTMDGAVTSQFENHLRAVAGMPLGQTDPTGFSAMINLVGDTAAAERLPQAPGRHLHLYGKSPRPGRKVGHINLVAPERDALMDMLANTARLLGDPHLDDCMACITKH